MARSETAPPALSASTSRPRKRPLAALIVGLIPGVGQWYVGQNAKGFALFFTALFLVSSPAPEFVLFAVALGGIDAYVLAKRLRAGDAIKPWQWFWSKTPQRVWQVIQVSKTGTSQEAAGNEENIIDNSRSGSKLTRTLKVSKEWSCTYTVQHEHSRTTIDTKSIRLSRGATKGYTVEDVVRDNYASTHGMKRVHEETVQIEVPPFKKVRVRLQWKNLLENGVVLIADQYDEEIELPYSVTVGVTFDQVQLDD